MTQLLGGIHISYFDNDKLQTLTFYPNLKKKSIVFTTFDNKYGNVTKFKVCSDGQLEIKQTPKDEEEKGFYYTVLKRVEAIQISPLIRNFIGKMNLFELENEIYNPWNIPINEDTKIINHKDSRYQNLSFKGTKQDKCDELWKLVQKEYPMFGYSMNDVLNSKLSCFEECNPELNFQTKCTDRYLAFISFLENNGYHEDLDGKEIVDEIFNVAVLMQLNELFPDKIPSLFELKKENAIFFLRLLKNESYQNIELLTKFLMNDKIIEEIRSYIEENELSKKMKNIYLYFFKERVIKELKNKKLSSSYSYEEKKEKVKTLLKPKKI